METTPGGIGGGRGGVLQRADALDLSCDEMVASDADGNMLNGLLKRTETGWTTAAYAYDSRNRLSALFSEGQSWSFWYDCEGNRVAVREGTQTTRYVINPQATLSQVLIRTKPNGTKTYYVYGAGLLYEADESENTLTYHYDYRGSTVALSTQTGQVTERMQYNPYGRLTYRGGQTDTPFLYNGRYGVMTDASTLLYMRARYYNPHLRRFINPDPIGFAGGMNFYAYADGNPVSYLDPFGLGEGSPSYWTKFLQAVRTILQGPSDHPFQRPFAGPGSGGPPPANSPSDGSATVVDTSVSSFNGFGVQAGHQELTTSSTGETYNYVYLGVGLGTPGESFSREYGVAYDVNNVWDYAGPFLNVSASVPGVGFSYSRWPGGASSWTVGPTVTGGPGASATFQYYLPPEAIFTVSPASIPSRTVIVPTTVPSP